MKSYQEAAPGILAEFDSQVADSPSYWDRHWQNQQIESSVNKTLGGYPGGMRFLKHKCDRDSVVLEAGCGRGQNVAALSKLCQLVVGIDWAQGTIQQTKSKFTKLNLICGNLQNLPFMNKNFSHYISLGVIEHFSNPHAVEEILSEARRVTEKYIFISVPFFSRGLKGHISKKALVEKEPGQNFYQYYFTKQAFTNLLRENKLNPSRYVFYGTSLGLKRNNFLFRKIYERSKIFRYLLKKTANIINLFFGKSYAHMIGAWCTISGKLANKNQI